MGKLALVDRYGAFLSAKEGRFQLMLSGGGKAWELAPVEVDSIVFNVTGASLSASAVKLACDFGIDLVFLDHGRPVARLLPATYGSTMRTWLRQLKAHRRGEERVRLAKAFVEGKVHNQRVVLSEYLKRLKASGRRAPWLASAIQDVDAHLAKLSGVRSVDEARVVESAAAKAYWRAVAQLLPPQLGFQRRLPRSRVRPGEEPDPFNKALNLGYAALRKEAWRAVFLAGLNPYLGFLHASRPGRMSLVLDLMEEFRPVLVDRPLIALARRSPEKLVEAAQSQEGAREVWRAVVNQLYADREPNASTILRQARLLARHLNRVDEYRPFKLRW